MVIFRAVDMRSYRKIFKRAVAGTMSIWLSGFVFIFCCHMAPPTGPADHCPLEKLGVHCDRAEKERNSAKLKADESQQGIDCCAFIPAFFDKTRNVDNGARFVSGPTATIESKSAALRFQIRPAAISGSYRSALIFKNHTFLINRTIRI